jgi:hypothetical protein
MRLLLTSLWIPTGVQPFPGGPSHEGPSMYVDQAASLLPERSSEPCRTSLGGSARGVIEFVGTSRIGGVAATSVPCSEKTLLA